MIRPEACEGRSVRKDKDATCRVVAKRLAWLAKDSNWDGTLPPPPKLLPPPPSGLKSATGGRREIGGTSPNVEQAPGWDGQVTDIPRRATPNEQVATTTRKVRHACNPHREEHRRKGTHGASKAVSAQQDGGFGEMPIVEKGKLIASTAGAENKGQNAAGQLTEARLPGRPFGADGWPATHDRSFWHPELEGEGEDDDDEDEGALFSDDQDTAAGDDNSSGASRPTTHESDVRRSAPRADESISELSCSGIFTIPSTVGDDQGNEDESIHDSSSESPNQTRATTPRADDDIGSSHVEYLIQERRRWKLRAFDSEHELAAFQSLHARVERNDGERGMEPRSAGAIELQASESFSESMASETSVVESESDLVPSASSFSTPSIQGAHRPRGFLDTVSDAQLSGTAVATTDCSPVSGARYNVAGLENDSKIRFKDGNDIFGGQGENGTSRLEIEGTGGGDYHELLRGAGGRTHRLLRKDIADLKENLRRAELRHAAAEATAVSALERARAAELSRDVKEIQIRNLEIRLAKYTQGTKHHRDACARWRERQNFGGGESADDGITLDLFQPSTEPQSTVVEEREEVKWPYESIRNDSTCVRSTAENHEANGVGGLAAGGRRAALDRFRHDCCVLGAKAARAGGGAMSVAAAVASDAAKEAVQSAKAAVGGRMGRETADDRCSPGERDGSTFDEYWGSDHCTSV